MVFMQASMRWLVNYKGGIISTTPLASMRWSSEHFQLPLRYTSATIFHLASSACMKRNDLRGGKKKEKQIIMFWLAIVLMRSSGSRRVLSEVRMQCTESWWIAVLWKLLWILEMSLEVMERYSVAVLSMLEGYRQRSLLLFLYIDVYFHLLFTINLIKIN